MSFTKLIDGNVNSFLYIAIVSQQALANQAFQQVNSLLTDRWPKLRIKLISVLGQTPNYARSINIVKIEFQQLQERNVSRETVEQKILEILNPNICHTCFILQVFPLDLCLLNFSYERLCQELESFDANKQCSMQQNSININLAANNNVVLKSDLNYQNHHHLLTLFDNCSDNLLKFISKDSAANNAQNKLYILYYENCLIITYTNLSFSVHRSPYFLDLWPDKLLNSEKSVARAEYKLRELSQRLKTSNLNHILPVNINHASQKNLASAHSLFVKQSKQDKQLFQVWSKAEHLAFDLGAAPGGWSQVLLEKNYQVIAIDPERLKIMANHNLWHFQGLSNQFLELAKAYNFELGSAQLLVNDMKLNYKQSLAITAEFLPYLASNAYIIQTLKLFKNESYAKQLKQIKGYLDFALNSCQIVFVRQLASNRSEVTIILQK